VQLEWRARVTSVMDWPFARKALYLPGLVCVTSVPSAKNVLAAAASEPFAIVVEDGRLVGIVSIKTYAEASSARKRGRRPPGQRGD